MADSYTIQYKNTSIDGMISQARAIKTFPCVIRIYDRVFMLHTKDEMWSFIHGLEVGYSVSKEEDFLEEVRSDLDDDRP